MFYSRRFLEQRIKEERFRTYRIGSPFSVVLFDPFKLVPHRTRNKREFINRTIESLNKETRETDIKGWWDRNTIAILLLDTQPKDALVLVDKLLSRIQTNNRDRMKSIKKASFEIFTFPNTQRLEKSANAERVKKDSKIPKQKSNQKFQKIDFSTVPLSDNSSIQSSFKTHQQLIKRFFDIIVSFTGLIIS